MQRIGRDRRRAAALGFFILVLPALVRASDPGSAGFLSLRLGDGARASGMGEAQVSLASDATAAYWNPAGLAAVGRTDFSLMHLEWISSVRMETASLAHATNLGVFGLHFSGLYLDEIPRTTTASGTPEGNFNAFEIAVSGAYGRKVASDWDFGLAVKGLYSKLDDRDAKGWAGDVGLRYHTKIAGLTFGAAGQNLGPKMKFVDEEFPLPATARAGADYARDVPALRGHLVEAVDIVLPTDGSAHAHAGIEYLYRDFASLRLGYKGGYDSQGLTFGVGLRTRGYHFDYSFADIRTDLGNGQRFSFSIDL
jgi:hypothetical protein